MNQLARARQTIFPPLTTAEKQLTKAIQSNNVDYKIRQYFEISSLLGNILSNLGAYPTNIRGISGGWRRATFIKEINQAIVEAYNQIYANRIDVTDYERMNISSVVVNEMCAENRELSDSEASRILSSVGKSNSNRYDPAFNSITQDLNDSQIEGLPQSEVHSRPTNRIEWMILELCDRIRCDIVKSRNI